MSREPITVALVSKASGHLKRLDKTNCVGNVAIVAHCGFLENLSLRCEPDSCSKPQRKPGKNRRSPPRRAGQCDFLIAAPVKVV